MKPLQLSPQCPVSLPAFPLLPSCHQVGRLVRLSSRCWSCHVFQQEQKSSSNHLWKLYPASILMQHKGMVIKYLSIHLPPGTRNGLHNHLLTKAAYHRSEGWKSHQVEHGRMTVKGKGHLSAQATSVLGHVKECFCWLTS